MPCDVGKWINLCNWFISGKGGNISQVCKCLFWKLKKFCTEMSIWCNLSLVTHLHPTVMSLEPGLPVLVLSFHANNRGFFLHTSLIKAIHVFFMQITMPLRSPCSWLALRQHPQHCSGAILLLLKDPKNQSKVLLCLHSVLKHSAVTL